MKRLDFLVLELVWLVWLVEGRMHAMWKAFGRGVLSWELEMKVNVELGA